MRREFAALVFGSLFTLFGCSDSSNDESSTNKPTISRRPATNSEASADETQPQELFSQDKKYYIVNFHVGGGQVRSKFLYYDKSSSKLSVKNYNSGGDFDKKSAHWKIYSSGKISPWSDTSKELYYDSGKVDARRSNIASMTWTIEAFEEEHNIVAVIKQGSWYLNANLRTSRSEFGWQIIPVLQSP